MDQEGGQYPFGGDLITIHFFEREARMIGRPHFFSHLGDVLRQTFVRFYFLILCGAIGYFRVSLKESSTKRQLAESITVLQTVQSHPWGFSFRPRPSF